MLNGLKFVFVSAKSVIGAISILALVLGEAWLKGWLSWILLHWQAIVHALALHFPFHITGITERVIAMQVVMIGVIGTGYFTDRGGAFEAERQRAIAEEEEFQRERNERKSKISSSGFGPSKLYHALRLKLSDSFHLDSNPPLVQVPLFVMLGCILIDVAVESYALGKNAFDFETLGGWLLFIFALSGGVWILKFLYDSMRALLWTTGAAVALLVINYGISLSKLFPPPS